MLDPRLADATTVPMELGFLKDNLCNILKQNIVQWNAKILMSEIGKTPKSKCFERPSWDVRLHKKTSEN